MKEKRKKKERKEGRQTERKKKHPHKLNFLTLVILHMYISGFNIIDKQDQVSWIEWLQGLVGKTHLKGANVLFIGHDITINMGYI